MIDLNIEGGIAYLTMDRPEKHNAMELDDLRAFSLLLDELAARDDLRVLVLTGAGEKTFCSGVSLGDVGGNEPAGKPLTDLCDKLEAFPLPTIAALNGGVYGGGVEIALACDFRIGVYGSRMFVPPAKLGIHYDPKGIDRLMRRVGAQLARRVFLLAETFDADEMLLHGFVDQLVRPENLAATAQEKAEMLASFAPLAVRGMKRTIRELSAGRLDQEAAAIRVDAAWASDDLAEGLAAMKEKRQPIFKGC